MQQQDGQRRRGKYRDASSIDTSIEINGATAISMSRIQAILTELASEIAEEHKDDPAWTHYEPRQYSRFAAHRILREHLQPALRTENATYYYEDDVRTLKQYLHPERGTKRGRTHYPAEIKAKAVQLYREGRGGYRAIARILSAEEGIEVSDQSVNDWIKAATQGK